MANYDTLTDLLIDQPERRLKRLEKNLIGELARLGDELKVVQQAIARKASAANSNGVAPIAPRKKAVGNTGPTGRFEGLSRQDLLRHAEQMNRPVFRAPDLQQYLATKGIDRRVEAIRTGLGRLAKDGLLVRTPDGAFAVHPANGDGHGTKVEAGISPASKVVRSDSAWP